MISVWMLHDFVLIFATLVALTTAGIKIMVVCKRHDSRAWLHIWAALACLWLAAIWLGQAIDLIEVGPIGLSLAVPGVTTLIALEAVQTFV